GNMNPVTLVRMIVTRNSAVQPRRRRAPSMPHTTTNPLNSAISVMMTWTTVNACTDSPKIITTPQYSTKTMLNGSRRPDQCAFGKAGILQSAGRSYEMTPNNNKNVAHPGETLERAGDANWRSRAERPSRPPPWRFRGCVGYFAARDPHISCRLSGTHAAVRRADRYQSGRGRLQPRAPLDQQ